MVMARVSWVGPSFLSTIRQETPCRLSSAAMNRPTGPAPTTNTWVSVAIRDPLVNASCADPTQSRRGAVLYLDTRALVSSAPLTLPHTRPCVDTLVFVIGGDAEFTS